MSFIENIVNTEKNIERQIGKFTFKNAEDVAVYDLTNLIYKAGTKSRNTVSLIRFAIFLLIAMVPGVVLAVLLHKTPAAFELLKTLMIRKSGVKHILYVVFGEKWWFTGLLIVLVVSASLLWHQMKVFTTLEQRNTLALNLIRKYLDAGYRGEGKWNAKELLKLVESDISFNRNRKSEALKVANTVGVTLVVPMILKFDPFSSAWQFAFWIEMLLIGFILLGAYRDTPEFFENMYVRRALKNEYAKKMLKQLADNESDEYYSETNQLKTEAPKIDEEHKAKNQDISKSFTFSIGRFEVEFRINQNIKYDDAEYTDGEQLEK